MTSQLRIESQQGKYSAMSNKKINITTSHQSIYNDIKELKS